MRARPEAPAATRNTGALRSLLEKEFEDVTTVLEIGSGTGQHAVAFATALPWLSWQTSDLVENHAAICAWIEDADVDNVLPPLALDVRHDRPGRRYGAVFSANTAHIMPIDAVKAMFSLVGVALLPGGLFCLYGPFSRDGRFSTPSNAAFNESLERQGQGMGIRALEDLDRFAAFAGLARERVYAMPANNLAVTWRKQPEIV